MASNRANPVHALRIQLILAGIGLALGIVVLPTVVFTVGNSIIGTYAGGAHRLGSFYGNFFADLTNGSPIAWTLAIVPYVLLLLLRFIFWRSTAAQGVEDTEAPREQARKEPRIS